MVAIGVALAVALAVVAVHVLMAAQAVALARVREVAKGHVCKVAVAHVHTDAKMVAIKI